SVEEGKVHELGEGYIVVKHTEKHNKEYSFGIKEKLLVSHNDLVSRGQPLTRGHLNLQEVMQSTDVYTAQKYIMTEVQHIYASQGQTINDKHVEIIVKQMFSKVRISNPGDSSFLPGEMVNAER